MQRTDPLLELRVVTTEAELEAALALRHTVFVREQGVSPELEVDEFDCVGGNTTHAVARQDGELIATGRLRVVAARVGKLERLAVRAPDRRRGVGRAVSNFLEQAALGQDLEQLILNSQQAACGFYEKLGYRKNGAPFLEAGILHVVMTKPLITLIPSGGSAMPRGE